MKRVIAITFFTLLLAGCAENNIDGIPVDSKVSPEFYASFEDNAISGTKTYVDGEMTLRWTKGDRVSIFVGKTYNQEYKYVGETGANNGGISAVSVPGFVAADKLNANYAVYPYSASNEIDNYGNISVVLPAVQQYAENSFGLGANTMVAATEDKSDMTLQFRNLCGYLVVKLYGEGTVSSVILEGNNGEKISGRASVQAEYGEAPSVTMSSTASTSVTIDCGEGVTLGTTAETATEFWFCVPPVTFSEGFTIAVQNSDGMGMTKSVTSSRSIIRNTANTMTPLPVTFDDFTGKIKALCFSADGPQMMKLVNYGGNAPSLQYSYDGFVWDEWDYSYLTFGEETENPVVYIRGNNPYGFSSSQKYSTFKFSTTSKVRGEGNIMHLLSYTEDLENIPSYNCYSSLFSGCNYLTVAPDLPATTLADACYESMFSGCTRLSAAPTLPATTMAKECYMGMFSGCTSLSTAPTLSATILADMCYESMFSGCTSLSAAPTLPATTLADNCYRGMFSGCTSLSTAPALPATTLAEGCYGWMFSSCTSLSAAPALPATILAEECYMSMFEDCPSLTTAPDLPATTLADGCYSQMFFGCTRLSTAPTLPATTLAEECYTSMFWDCPSLTTAPDLPATTLAYNCYAQMFRRCTSLTAAPALPATILADGCYRAMFDGCTISVAPNLPATTLADNCYSGMFDGCTISAAPNLPATTLADGCYSRMFSGCTNLSVAPALPATTLAEGCYRGMFRECTNLSAAPALPATTLADNCYSEMFYGCTSLSAAPDLPATILADGCYGWMFYQCGNLSYVKALFTTYPSYIYTERWLYGVSYNGTFVKSKDATWDVTGSNGVPGGWTVVTE